MDECKRSGQIPSFGNWDFSNELPITQYFECARQAGLVRYSSSSGESDPNYLRGDHRDLYSLDHHFKKPPVRNIPPSTLKKGTRNYREKRYPHHHHHVNVMVKDKESMMMNTNMRKQGKVCDVMEQPPRNTTISKQLYQNDTVSQCSSPNRGGGGLGLPPYNKAPKPVDEDLYKIPPELLRGTKRKKMLGFISKCLVPAACVS